MVGISVGDDRVAPHIFGDLTSEKMSAALVDILTGVRGALKEWVTRHISDNELSLRQSDLLAGELSMIERIVTEIPASWVKSVDGNIITYTIHYQEGAKERKEEERKCQMIGIVMQQVSVSRADAIRLLEENKSDVVDAIVAGCEEKFAAKRDFPEKDIETVMTEATVDRERAIRLLSENKGDVINAIVADKYE